jgi:glycosyltransferase involved in cell wall biosynthesis
MADRALLFRDALDAPRRLITPSDHVLRRFVNYGVARDRIVTLRNAADVSALQGVPPASPTKPVVFGYIGTLYPHKGPHVLIEAANAMDPAVARFLIAGKGDPEYTGKLRSCANNPSIEFLGEIARNEVPSFYRLIHALVVPSISLETGPIVGQEAIAAGRPVIGSNLDAISELITHETNGLLFPPGDARALRAALERVAADPAQLARMAQALPEPAAPQTWAALHEQLYEQVIQED